MESQQFSNTLKATVKVFFGETINSFFLFVCLYSSSKDILGIILLEVNITTRQLDRGLLLWCVLM